ncbi:hypothetical protein U9M48_027187 [Paspalum notatum var. saurae]|uniref:Uncharacterized protein n=1 Tax=Paspalum notatum var. saurae TaxID=547442 RepID=A0AAQ3TW08_PASNO
MLAAQRRWKSPERRPISSNPKAHLHRFGGPLTQAGSCQCQSAGAAGAAAPRSAPVVRGGAGRPESGYGSVWPLRLPTAHHARPRSGAHFDHTAFAPITWINDFKTRGTCTRWHSVSRLKIPGPQSAAVKVALSLPRKCPQVYTGWRGFALQTTVLSDDPENQMEKVEALREMLWKPQVKVPFGEWSTSELCSTEREEPAERKS